jgi:antitoxin HicB
MFFRALFEPESDGGFSVTFPELEWGVTQGDNEEEALSMAVDCIVTVLGELIAQGKPIPRSPARGGKNIRFVSLPFLVGAKVELYSAWIESGLSKSELARRMGIPKTNVDRLFSFKRSTRLEQLEAAFTALGKRIDLEVREAAAA